MGRVDRVLSGPALPPLGSPTMLRRSRPFERTWRSMVGWGCCHLPAGGEDAGLDP